MLKQGEVAQLIRKKCGMQPCKDEDRVAFFTREEQLCILAHIVKQDEILKESQLNTEMIQTVTDRVLQNLRTENEGE